MTKNEKRLKVVEAQISILATLMIQQIEPNSREDVKVITLRNEKKLKESLKIEKKMAPPKDEAPTKEVTMDVIDKGKNILTLEKGKCAFPLKKFEVVNLTKEYSAIVLKKFLPKLKYPRCFTLACTIGNLYFVKALCDLGVSINNHHLVEDILVKIGEFILSTNFVILDMEEDDKVPITLGRPFLDIGRVVIDV
ncbi:hypothetical protein CR513_57023, partial [Mucuna pruriens]